jgi:hypothetical protein
MFCRSLFVLLPFFFQRSLSFLRFTESDYPFGIFKLFFFIYHCLLPFPVYHWSIYCLSFDLHHWSFYCLSFDLQHWSFYCFFPRLPLVNLLSVLRFTSLVILLYVLRFTALTILLSVSCMYHFQEDIL